MDPQQQQQIAGMMAGMGIVFLLISVLITAFFVFIFWRVFVKAGMSGALGLLVLIPVIG